ncbi:MAG: hypothetical protein AB7E23_00405 [Bacilli bacterium]|jgi:uncharacterized membrane protein
MGELKGQILGLLLVILTFGLLVAAFSGIFNGAIEDIVFKANEILGLDMAPTTSAIKSIFNGLSL